MTRVLGATAAARVLLLTLLLLVLAPALAVPTERQRVVAMPVPTDVAPLAQALASAAAGVTPAQGLRWGNAAAQTLSQAPAMPPAGTDGGSEDIRAIVADPDDAGAEQVRPAWFLTASVYGVRRKGRGSEAQLPPVAVQRRKKAMVPESSSMFLALHHLLDYVRPDSPPVPRDRSGAHASSWF